MTNLYHIIDKEPALEYEDMPIELEALAERFIKSGLLRIDANQKINFARFSLPRIGFNKMFSKLELYDKSLLPVTKRIIKSALRMDYGNVGIDRKVEEYLVRLRAEIKKYIPIEEDMEMKLARIIIQLTHPVVIELVMLERVEVFISYSHNIGDVLDVLSWQHNGLNSGMQSTNGKEVAIYISCGGDPLFNKKNEKSNLPKNEVIYGDGHPALAKTMIVGGQEFGHYADIYRDAYGRQIARHSADFSGNMATTHVKRGRLLDLANIRKVKEYFFGLGLKNVAEIEREVKFYDKHGLRSLKNNIVRVRLFFIRKIFFSKIKSNFLVFMHIKKYKYPAMMIVSLFEDMSFNLAPQADVYKNADKNIEEAIACIEALARVPQQCNKWGDGIVRYLYTNLYKVYYDEVIPTCIRDYERLSGLKFHLSNSNLTSLSWVVRMRIKAIRKTKNILRKKITHLFKKTLH